MILKKTKSLYRPQFKQETHPTNKLIKKTRTKTSIRHAKENDKEKRERRKERERKVEGEI